LSEDELITPKHIQVIKMVMIPVIFFIWGVGVGGFNIFPFQIVEKPLNNLQSWWFGAQEGRQLSLSQKLSDLLLDSELRISGKSEVDKRFKLKLKPIKDPLGLLKESTRKLWFYSVHNDGYYVIFFIPKLPNARYAAAVINGSGELIKLIKVPISPESITTLGQGGVTDDGSLIFNSYFDLRVTDICGQVKFHIPMGDGPVFALGQGIGFHHKSSGDGQHIWSWYGNEIRQYSLSQKKLLKQISLDELISANPDSAIFEARLIKSNKKGTIGQWKYADFSNGLLASQIALHDPFHQNDVDVLTPQRATLFPQFKAGDLLLSFRSINLITVIDPQTLKVKWFHYGDFSRQHDPDWGLDGKITVYDNRSHQSTSRIISIDPLTHKVETLIDGDDWGFYQFAQGNHQYTGEDRVLFTNDSEAIHATNDRLDFYFKYVTAKGSPLDIGTVYYLNEARYENWLSACQH